MENANISSLQMAMMMYPTIVATAILTVPGTTASYADNDLWLSPILASLSGFTAIYIAVQLHKLYPGQTIIQYSERIIGQIPGKMISFLILLYLFASAGDIIRNYSEFIIAAFLFKTPIIVISGTILLLCAIVVYAGIEVLGRVTQLFFPLFFVPLIIFIFLAGRDFEPGNLLPVLENGMMPALKGAFMPSGWFAEFSLIIFLLPFIADMKNVMKYGMLSVFTVMITLSCVNLIVLFILGSTTAVKIYPLMIVARYISFANFFENLESVIMALWIVGVFIKLAVFLFTIALGTAQLFNLSDYRPIVWPIGILVMEFSFWSFPSTMSITRFEASIFPFWDLSIQIIIPLFLLLLTLLRKTIKNRTGQKTYLAPFKKD